MTIDPRKVQYASTLEAVKNFDTKTGSISIPSQSYTSTQYRTFTTAITLDRNDNTFQILQNFSFSSTNWWVGSWVQVTVDANFITQTRFSLNGNILTAVCYVVNESASTHTVGAFTLNIEVRQYLAPFV